MFRHMLVEGIAEGEATMVIFGNAVFTDAHQMESELGKALDACRHLTIDVGGVEISDATFQVILCSLHRRSQLENKKVSMQGRLRRRENDRGWQPKVKVCRFNRTNSCCPFCDTAAEKALKTTEQLKT